MSDIKFVNSGHFVSTLQLLEASYFLMNLNETRHLHSFEYIQRIEMQRLDPPTPSRQRRARTEEEKEDDKLNVIGPFPEHSGGNFKKIEPEFTAEFFDAYVNRKASEKAQRRSEVLDFLESVGRSMLDRIPVIRDREIFCSDRERRSEPESAEKKAEGNKSLSPMVAMKLLLRGSIKGLSKDVVKPNMNEAEANFLRENYEFSSNMYKFVYSQDKKDIIQAPFGAEEKPRHFHSKEEAKKFVDDVTEAFLEYQGQGSKSIALF